MEGARCKARSLRLSLTGRYFQLFNLIRLFNLIKLRPLRGAARIYRRSLLLTDLSLRSTLDRFETLAPREVAGGRGGGRRSVSLICREADLPRIRTIAMISTMINFHSFFSCLDLRDRFASSSRRRRVRLGSTSSLQS